MEGDKSFREVFKNKNKISNPETLDNYLLCPCLQTKEGEILEIAKTSHSMYNLIATLKVGISSQ
jgi:hypothetical protein